MTTTTPEPPRAEQVLPTAMRPDPEIAEALINWLDGESVEISGAEWDVDIDAHPETGLVDRMILTNERGGQLRVVLSAVVVGLLALVLAGCASRATPTYELPQIAPYTAPETPQAPRSATKAPRPVHAVAARIPAPQIRTQAPRAKVVRTPGRLGLRTITAKPTTVAGPATPGAWCGTWGALGRSADGVPMRCQPAPGDPQRRWRSIAPAVPQVAPAVPQIAPAVPQATPSAAPAPAPAPVPAPTQTPTSEATPTPTPDDGATPTPTPTTTGDAHNA